LLLRDVRRLADAGVVSKEDAARWSDGLRAADGEGLFFSSYTGFFLRGTRRKCVELVA
jgi:hypothetical protein